MKTVRQVFVMCAGLGTGVLLMGAASPTPNPGPPSEMSTDRDLTAVSDANNAQELASCVSWDIKELCCPGYCAAKNGSNWSSADKIFDNCIVGLGCKSRSTTGFLSCDCPKK